MCRTNPRGLGVYGRSRAECAGELGGARLRSRACAFVSVCVCWGPGCVLTRSRLLLELRRGAGEKEGQRVWGLHTAEGERGVIRLECVSPFSLPGPKLLKPLCRVGSVWVRCSACEGGSRLNNRVGAPGLPGFGRGEEREPRFCAGRGRGWGPLDRGGGGGGGHRDEKRSPQRGEISLRSHINWRYLINSRVL